MRPWARLLLIASGVGVIALCWAMYASFDSVDVTGAILLSLFAVVGLDLVLAGLIGRGPWLLQNMWEAVVIWS